RTSASDGLSSPQASGARVTFRGSSRGGTPASFTTPVRAPPSGTDATSYADTESAAPSTTARASTSGLTPSGLGIEEVREGQPQAAAVAEEPQGKDDDERDPQGELHGRGESHARPEDEIA